MLALLVSHLSVQVLCRHVFNRKHNIYNNFILAGCLKVLKAVKEMSISMNNQDKTSISLSAALDKYCALSALDVDDQQFCYNIETMRGDINRLLDMGADETRVCKKVRSINPHFCSGEKKQSKEKKTVHVNQSQRKGIIFS